MIFSASHPLLSNALVGLALFGGIVGMTLLGRRAGARFLDRAGEDPPGLGAVEGALFGLLGLVVALTFTGAATRFADRRELVLREAQAISTAYSRLDLLAPEVRADLQARFRDYLGRRLDAYRTFGDMQELDLKLARSAEDGAEIWRIAVEACRRPETATFAELVLLPINDMLDVATARRHALGRHPPAIVYLFLCGLALACALFAGFGMARGVRLSRIHVAGFALVTSLTIVVTMDMEHPRLGAIQVSDADVALEWTLEAMR